jgi:hypothetical protein
LFGGSYVGVLLIGCGAGAKRKDFAFTCHVRAEACRAAVNTQISSYPFQPDEPAGKLVAELFPGTLSAYY